MKAKANSLLAVLTMALSVVYTCTYERAWAAEQLTSTTSSSNLSNTGAAIKPINLNLNSTIANTTAGNMAAAKPVNISVGGNNMEVSPTTPLTPAQRLAVYQVVSTGQQSILLGTNGNAIGGSLTIGPKFSQYVSGLVVPKNVSVFGDAAIIGNLNLTGNLSNFGNIFMVSSSQQVNTASISALNITNNRGGLITSVLPSEQLAGIAAIQNLNLSLIAVNNIVNAGTISSSGNLLLAAGGTINNGAAALIQAVGNVNMSSQIGNFINSGTIASFTANVNFDTGNVVRDIMLNNAAGSIQALNGSVNVRDSIFQSLANLDVSGGKFLAKELNLNSGSGSIVMDIESVSGVVNVFAGSAHVCASAGDLKIGTFNVSGDPYISTEGNLDLAGVISGPISYLVATAGGNIFSSAAHAIDTSSSTGNGGNVVLVAGALSENDNGNITLTRSGKGGNIYLEEGSVGGISSTAISGFNTSSSMSDADGGNITLIALASSTGSSTGGRIVLPRTLVLSANGSGSGRNGDITLIAESAAEASSSISAGSLGSASATYGSGGGGKVTLLAATANLATVSVNANTGALSGSFESDALQNGQIVFEGITTGGANSNSGIDNGRVLIKTLGSINSNSNINTTARSANGGNAGNINAWAGGRLAVFGIFAEGAANAGDGGMVSLFSRDTLSVNGEIRTYAQNAAGTGASVSLASESGSLLVNSDIRTYGANALSGAGGSGGSLALSSLGMIIVNGSMLSNGGSGSNAEAGGNGGHGGDISAVSQTGTLVINGAVNSNGGNGGEGIAGNGGAGGNAGLVSMSSAAGLSINGQLTASGGKGGEGAAAYTGGTGGNGAAIGLNTSNGNLMVNGQIHSQGGAGGFGASSQDLSSSAGNGGNGGNGASILINNSSGRLIVNGDINNSGGVGGAGGDWIALLQNSNMISAYSMSSVYTSEVDMASIGLTGGAGGLGGNAGTTIAISSENSISISGQVRSDGGNGGHGGNTGTLSNKPSSEKQNLTETNEHATSENAVELKNLPTAAEQGTIDEDSLEIASDESNNGKSEIAHDKSNNGKSHSAPDKSNNGKSDIAHDKSNNDTDAVASPVVETDAASPAAETAPAPAPETASEQGPENNNVKSGKGGNGGDGGTIVITSKGNLSSGEISAKGGNGGKGSPAGVDGKEGTVTLSFDPTADAQFKDAEVSNAAVDPSDEASAAGSPLIQYLDDQEVTLKVGNSGNELRINKGNILLNPETDLIVQTDKGTVKVAAGAMVMVMETGKDVAIYNLHDQHRDDVQVVVGDKVVSIPPGQQLVLSKESTDNFEKINPSQDIAFRNPKAAGLSKNGSSFLADFSITSALTNVKALKQLITSTSPNDQKAAGQMLKTAAISSLMSHSQTPFQKGK